VNSSLTLSNREKIEPALSGLKSLLLLQGVILLASLLQILRAAGAVGPLARWPRHRSDRFRRSEGRIRRHVETCWSINFGEALCHQCVVCFESWFHKHDLVTKQFSDVFDMSLNALCLLAFNIFMVFCLLKWGSFPNECRSWPRAAACLRRPADGVGERCTMNVQVVTTGAVGSFVQCLTRSKFQVWATAYHSMGRVSTKCA